MESHPPTLATLKALFAKSGNVCAFPDCVEPLVTEDGLFVGTVCHIEGRSKKGPRYNPVSTNDERRHYNNLILLCYPHHRRIDMDLEKYTADRIRDMKRRHENSVKSHIEVSASVVRQLEEEVAGYWKAVVDVQKRHAVPDLAVEIDPKADGRTIFRRLYVQVRAIGEVFAQQSRSDAMLLDELKVFLEKLDYDLDKIEAVHYSDNPFEARNDEQHFLNPNIITETTALLLQAELLYLIEYRRGHVADKNARGRMQVVKRRLKKIAKTAIYID